jgi:hypothetical protein
MHAVIRACLFIPDAVVGDPRGEEYAAEQGQGVLVVAGGDAPPVLEAVEAAHQRRQHRVVAGR